ncbi:MAG: hypothetical protein ACKPKO_65985 [Candidatus Fonsibacter sp.]
MQGTITGKVCAFQYLSITGTTGRPHTPTARGCYIGQATTSYTTIELCSNPLYQSFIDFTVPNSDYEGRLLYNYPTDEFRFHAASSSTARMTLTGTTLTLVGDIKANNFEANGNVLN